MQTLKSRDFARRRRLSTFDDAEFDDDADRSFTRGVQLEVMPDYGYCIWFLLSFVIPVTSSFSNFRLHLRKNERISSKDALVRRLATSHLVEGVIHLTHIDRVLCISDLHVDNADNMEWLANHTGLVSDGVKLCDSDLIVVAGDISHQFDRIEQSFSYLQRQGPSILFVPGNHEAWLNSSELESGNSLKKLERIYEVCDRMGVITGPVLVGNTEERPHGLWIAPLESWYDGTLSVENLGECYFLLFQSVLVLYLEIR